MKLLCPVLCVLCIFSTGSVVVSDDTRNAASIVHRSWNVVFDGWNKSLVDPIFEMMEKRAVYAKEYGEAHPTVKALTKQIEATKMELARICPDANFQKERIARIDDQETQRYVIELILKNRALELRLADQLKDDQTSTDTN